LKSNILNKLGIPVSESELAIPNVLSVKTPSAENVANRLLVLSYMMGVYYDVAGEELENQLRKYKLYAHLTDNEKSIIAKKEYTDEDFIEVGWWQECIQVLAWALGITNKIDHTEDAESGLAEKLPIMKKNESFLANAKLRSNEELYAAYFDLFHIYQYLLENEHLLLDADRVLERYRAIAWVVGDLKHWDNV
jgi:hypothetical protein